MAGGKKDDTPTPFRNFVQAAVRNFQVVECAELATVHRSPDSIHLGCPLLCGGAVTYNMLFTKAVGNVRTLKHKLAAM